MHLISSGVPSSLFRSSLKVIELIMVERKKGNIGGRISIPQLPGARDQDWHRVTVSKELQAKSWPGITGGKRGGTQLKAQSFSNDQSCSIMILVPYHGIECIYSCFQGKRGKETAELTNNPTHTIKSCSPNTKRIMTGHSLNKTVISPRRRLHFTSRRLTFGVFRGLQIITPLFNDTDTP